MNWIRTKDRLPEEKKYVIGKHNIFTWRDSDDQENVNTVIVKLVKGISEHERELMKKGEIDDPDRRGYVFPDGESKLVISSRSDTYCRGDEDGNNKVPYAWDTFGPGSFFGQEITHWMEIPDIEGE